MKTRGGFTLIELLTAIVIIGILASGMLLSGGSATSSARALTIVNDLRVMKEAVLLLYIDSMDYFDKGGDFGGLTPGTVLAQYVDNPGKYDNRYKFAVRDGRWYVSYRIGDGDAGAGDIRGRLAGRAQSTGLFESTRGDVYKGGETVYMLAR